MSCIRAAIIIIGNEILSGRTLDLNTQEIALSLSKIGVNVHEVRVVPDEKEVIIATVKTLSSTYDYVFTTGGIGPTHDDITAESVSEAFGVKCVIYQDIYDKLEQFYKNRGQELNEARVKMARIPEGANLLPSSETVAPGFNIKNVFVMAGIPKIMKTMLASALPLLKKGELMHSKSIDVNVGESVIAGTFSDLQQKYPNVEMGSYPFSDGDIYGTSLVLRSFDSDNLEKAFKELDYLICKLK